MAENKGLSKKHIVLGLVGVFVAVAIMVAAAMVFRHPSEVPSTTFRELAANANPSKDKIDIDFNSKCPQISSCSLDDIYAYFLWYRVNEVPMDSNPHLAEVKQLVQQKLDAQENNIDSVTNFWESFPSELIGMWAGLITPQEAKEKAIMLAQMGSDFCSHLYNKEPAKTTGVNNFGIRFKSKDEYLAKCHLRLVDTIFFSVSWAVQDTPSIEFYRDTGLNFQEVKAELCQDISEDTQYFSILSGFGVAYARNFLFCNKVLSDSDLSEIEQEYKANSDNPEIAFYYDYIHQLG